MICRPSSDDNTTAREQEIVTENDLEHLLQLLEVGNTTREWQSMMDKTTPNMSYQAWRHEPEVTLSCLLCTHVTQGTIQVID